MKRNLAPTIASLFSLLLLTLHLADDTVRGMFPTTGPGLLYAAIAAGLLLAGILLLAERRSGLAIMLLVSLFAIAMPYLHTRGLGVGLSAKSNGGFFFVWTLVALGMVGTVSFILAARELVRTRV